MTNKKKHDKRDGSTENSYDAIDSLTIATFDVDARIFRTIWHSITMPVDVMWAACRADFTRYLSPIRVLVAIVSMQIVIGALVGYPTAPSVATMADSLPADRVQAWLDGRSIAEIDSTFTGYMSMLMWPLMILSSLPVLLALKLMRWRLKFWAHTMAFLVATNASSFVQIASLPLALISPVLVVATLPLGLIFYVVQLGRIIARYYARSAWGLTWRVGIIAATLPITVGIMILGNFVAASWLLHHQHGLSLVELYTPQ